LFVVNPPENNEFVNTVLNKYNLTIEEFKKNVTDKISNLIIFFENESEKTFEILKNIGNLDQINFLNKYSEDIENEIEKRVNEYETKKEKLGEANLYYLEPKFKVKGPVINLLSLKYPNEIIMLVSLRENGMVTISARNQSKRLDMASLMKAGIKGLKDSNAGGHFAASGAGFKKEDYGTFKQNIKDFFDKS